MVVRAISIDRITDRVAFWWESFRPLWMIITILYAIFGVLTLFRDNFMSPDLQRRYATMALIPRLSWKFWVPTFVVMFVAALLEGAYRAFKKREAAVKETPIVAAQPQRHQIAVSANPLSDPTPQPRSTRLVCTRVLTTRLTVGALPQRLVKSEHGDESVLAVIANDPGDGGAVELNGVSAQIVYAREGQEMAAGFATWADVYSHYANFKVGQRHEIVLAKVEEQLNEVEAVFNPDTSHEPVFMSQRVRMRWAMNARQRLRFVALTSPLDVHVSMLGTDGEVIGKIRFSYLRLDDGSPSFTLLT